MQDAVVLTSCGHKFCVDCARRCFSQGRNRCPLCMTSLKIPSGLRTIHRHLQRNDADAQDADSDDVNIHGSKLVRLAALLRKLLSADPNEKIIVFAQFERLLRLIGRALTLLNIGVEFVTVRGSIHQCQRSIDRFRNDASVRIMLLSSETTISGITLIEANHVIAVHPPFVPSAADDERVVSVAVEDDDDDDEALAGDGNTEREYSLLWQAIGRVHRIAQTRPCHLWSLVTNQTLEENMYERQLAFVRKRHRDVKIEIDD